MAATGQNPAQSGSDPLLHPGSFIDANGQGPAPVVTPEKGKRKPPEGDLDWLPTGWTFEDRVRSSGATAGSIDRYYFDPTKGRKFRSKKEVLHFLETGARNSRKKVKSETSDGDGQQMDKNESKKQTPDKTRWQKQKSNTTEKKGSAANFNFSKVPEKVQWVLADSTEESWNAFISDKPVPDSSKLDWLAAFTFLASKDRGRYH